jgi:hypothetical protein
MATKKIIHNIKKNTEKTVQNPLATAVWLVDNTSLTFKQIAIFCKLHDMEVTAIANGTFAEHIIPISPINISLSAVEIDRCQKDENSRLNFIEEPEDSEYDELVIPKQKTKKYTPLLQRRSKADAILWILSFAPELSNKQIIKLIGSTENTVESIRNKSHRGIADLTPKDPVIVGLCTQRDLDNTVRIAKERIAILNDNK